MGRANDRSWVVGGIDTGTMRVRLRTHSDACEAGAGGRTKDQEVGKATAGQEA